MVKKIIYSFVFAAAILSCNNNAKKNPVTDIEVATTFIRAVLDNDFNTAQKYLLQDEVNQQYFKSYQQQYQSNTQTDLQKYKAADILINTLQPLNDTTTVINFSNSYKKEIKKNIKLLRSNGLWLIDFKYTFSENK